MTNESFLYAIINQTDDDTVRLVYADWLEERGDRERADFIRIQIELKTLNVNEDSRRRTLIAKEKILLSKNQDEWLKPFQGLVNSVEFHRGFVENVTMEDTQFIEQSDFVFTIAPIIRVKFGYFWNNVPGLLKRLRNCTCIEQIAYIDLLFGCYQANDAWLQQLAESPILLHRLNTLHIVECDISKYGLRSLLRSSDLRSLEHLSLTECNLPGQSVAKTVSNYPNSDRLISLSLANNNLRDIDADVLAMSPHFSSSLEYLSLSDNNIGDSGVKALAQSEYFAKLTCLDLSNNMISDTGAQALIDSPNFRRLNKVFTYGNLISKDNIRRLREINCPS